MIKNLPYTVKEGELRELFERYGSLLRFIVSPSNTLGIAEYETASQAKAAMKNLAYHQVNYITPIYLEYAPVGFVKEKKRDQVHQHEEVEDPEEESDDELLKIKQKQQR